MLVTGDVVPEASKKTASGATPEVRLATTESAGGPATGHASVDEGGGVPDEPVVKLQVKLAASALPAASRTAVVMVAVYWVAAARGTDGANIAAFPLMLSVPASAVPPEVFASLKVAVLSVELFIGSEKVAETAVLSATPVALAGGDVADTVGAVVSRTAAVVKVQLKVTGSALPAASFAAVVIVAVYWVPPTRLTDGVNPAEFPLTTTVPLTATPPDVVAKRKLAVVNVEFVIASENVADIEEFSATAVVAFAGDVEMTVGGIVSGAAAVVNFQVKSPPSALPAASFAAVVIVAVYWVLPAKLADGVNLAVLPLMLTVPLTDAPPEVVASVKLEVVNVEFVIASEKLADTEAFSAAPVAAFAGDAEETIGGVVSSAAPVVKVQLKSAPSALPAASVTPVVMVAVYSVFAERLAEGANVVELLLALTTPTTVAPARVDSLKVELLNVVFSIASENVADITEFNATAVAAFAGEVEDTIGGVVSAPSVVATATFDWPEIFHAASTAQMA